MAPLARVLLVFNGLAQMGGAAMVAYGLAVPEAHLVRDTSAATIVPTPIVLGHAGGGVGIVGTF
jgi:hypothetical protein